MPTLSDHVIATVSPVAYYDKQFTDLHWPGTTEARVVCCFHEEKTGSLSLNPETGAWFCHGCGVGGKSIVSFHAKRNELDPQIAAAEIFDTFIHPTVDRKLIRLWKRELKVVPSAGHYLLRQRLLKKEVIEAHDIGWNGDRFTIPIKNEFGLYVNVKKYDPAAKSKGMPKMLNHRDKEKNDRVYGSPAEVFPLSVFPWARELGYIVVCEGEWDALFLIGLGIPAVTMTAGSKSWAKHRTELFRGLKVFIAYDNDHDGVLYDKKVVLRNLREIAHVVRRIDIPRIAIGNGKHTKDVTDWAVVDEGMRKESGWKHVMRKAKTLVKNDLEVVAKPDVIQVPLDQASKSQWYNKPIRVEALVTGKDTAPYLLPKHYRATCSKSCDTCPMVDSDKQFKDVHIDPKDPRVLRMIDEKDGMMRKTMLGMAGMSDAKNCEAKCEVLSTFNLEQLALIPTLEGKSTQYVVRSSYYVGHGLHSNRGYNFEGTTIPHPQDQHATHLFYEAKPIQDEVDTFTMTPDLLEKLKVFGPGRLTISAHLMRIAEWQSRHITKIRMRPDLHIAVDLVYHSLASFNFNGEFLKRGMLDVLIIGDTRCGKGFVAEGLRRYYGLGEVASAEMCSFAGLVGGLQQLGTRWIVTWGLIPLNNNRLVVIDEASALAESDFSKMSRVRSEGVAEISKIVRESTQACTRLLWLSNTRDGRSIMEQNCGVMAIKQLVGANEDISRFDFAVTVATNEVPSDIINTVNVDRLDDGGRYPQDLCRSLVLWAWSRRPDQVRFSKLAVDEVIRQAIEFGGRYSSKIPLVQAENIRVKIAKLAAAVAARTFSTDETGELVLIEPPHVQAACQFLRMLYEKPSMAYDVFSQTAISTITIDDQDPLNTIFKDIGDHREAVIDGLLEVHRITSDNLTDYIGDPLHAKTVIGELVKIRCLTRIEGGNWYLKNPAFTEWLRSNRPNRKEFFDGPAKAKGRRARPN